MGRFGIPEDEPIENSMVTRALESAQTKIEGFNFDARKHVLEYDNVLDKQRRAIYARRNKILVGSEEDVAEVLRELATAVGGGSPEAMTAESAPALELIAKKEEELGRPQLLAAARTIVLQTLDMLWVEHLEAMEYLRGSVNLRAYGQRDPLVEYRKEGTRIYKDMELMLAGHVFELIEKLTKEGLQAGSLAATPAPAPVINIPGVAGPQGAVGGPNSAQASLGRNDPCPCGSGKKWKNCGLKNTPEHQQLMAEKSHA